MAANQATLLSGDHNRFARWRNQPRRDSAGRIEERVAFVTPFYLSAPVRRG
jgi:hypothetical protein